MQRSYTTYFSQLDSAALSFWGNSEESNGHGLLAHMFDVAAVTETIELESESGIQWGAKKIVRGHLWMGHRQLTPRGTKTTDRTTCGNTSITRLDFHLEPDTK